MNPTLEATNDGDIYGLSLKFAGSLSGAGTYDLTGSSLAFTDNAASEVQFSSISLTVPNAGADYDVSLFACVIGANCFSGNYLTASFSVPVADLGVTNTTFTGLDQPHPFELLEPLTFREILVPARWPSPQLRHRSRVHSFLCWLLFPLLPFHS